MKNVKKYYYKAKRVRNTFEKRIRRNRRVKKGAFVNLVNCSIRENGHADVYNEDELTRAKELYKDIFEATEDVRIVIGKTQKVSITVITALLALIVSKQLFVTPTEWISAGLVYLCGVFAPIAIDSASNQFASEKAKCDRYIANMTLKEYRTQMDRLKRNCSK